MSDQQPRRTSREPAPESQPTAGQTPGADPAPEPAEPPARGQSEVDRLLLAQAAQVEARREEAAADSLADYQEPDPLATAWIELDLRCPACNITHYVPTCTFLNAEESPHLLERLADGQFNLKRCPLCRKIEPIDYPFTVYIPRRKLAVQIRSEWEYHAGGGEEWHAARLEDFYDRWAAHDVRIDVVFGQDTFRARYLAGEGGGPGAEGGRRKAEGGEERAADDRASPN